MDKQIGEVLDTLVQFTLNGPPVIEAKKTATQTIKSLITAEIIAELERLHNKFGGLGFSSELPKDFIDGLEEAQKAFLTEIEDRIKYYKAKETQL